MEGMSTETNPLAQVTEYRVRLGSQPAFEQLLVDLREFYLSIDYPYPVEAFKPLYFTPGQYIVVVFPDTWEAFYGVNDLDKLADGAGRLEDLSVLRERLDEVLLSITTFEITYAPDLSFNPRM